MTNEDYEAGRRDGRISALEEILARHDDRINSLEKSMRIQERVTYGLLGALAFIQLIPKLEVLLS